MTPIALDSANGIAWISAFDNSDNELPFSTNTIYRFDLRRIYPYLLTAESLESKKPITVWPNPFDDQLQLNISSFGITYNLTITDMQGRQLLSQQITNGQLSVGTDHLPSGLYVLTVTDDLGSSVSQRMVKLNR